MDSVALLKTKGIQPSVQRIRILDYLFCNRVHPTVDDIYAALHPEIPTLSRTTVYNTVKLFASEGLVQPLVIEENEIRYDIDTSFHGHFRCDCCGRIYDFSAGDVGRDPANLLQGFSFRTLHVYGMGLCRDCRETQKN